MTVTASYDYSAIKRKDTSASPTAVYVNGTQCYRMKVNGTDVIHKYNTYTGYGWLGRVQVTISYTCKMSFSSDCNSTTDYYDWTITSVQAVLYICSEANYMPVDGTKLVWQSNGDDDIVLKMYNYDNDRLIASLNFGKVNGSKYADISAGFEQNGYGYSFGTRSDSPAYTYETIDDAALSVRFEITVPGMEGVQEDGTGAADVHSTAWGIGEVSTAKVNTFQSIPYKKSGTYNASFLLVTSAGGAADGGDYTIKEY